MASPASSPSHPSAILGGAVGLLIAKWAAGLLVSFRPPLPVPIALDVSLDGRVLAFAALLAALTGLIAGAAPAFRATRFDLVSSLKGTATDSGRRHRAPALQSVLVVGQVATCVVLLTMAGLLLGSLRAAQNVDLGFDPDDVAIFSTELGSQGYDEARGRTFYEELLNRAEALPSVRAASFAESTPLGLGYSRRGVSVEGYEPGPGEDMEFGANIVGPGYLGLMRIPLASIGLHGVMAYAVAQRARELGIRMALGAEPAGIWHLSSGARPQCKVDADGSRVRHRGRALAVAPRPRGAVRSEHGRPRDARERDGRTGDSSASGELHPRSPRHAGRSSGRVERGVSGLRQAEQVMRRCFEPPGRYLSGERRRRMVGERGSLIQQGADR